MAYTDSDANFGASFQARLISNPVTHVLNSAFLTVDSFAHSLNLGRYSAYIKAEGVADMLFSFIAINDDEEATVPKLLKLIHKNAYKFKEIDNVHIDVVIFSKYRVVFSMHINKDNIDNYADNPLFIELLSLLIDYNSVSFPVFDYNYLVSDLGTGITISTDITEVASYELKGLKEIFNSSSSSLLNEDKLAECTSNYRSIWYYSLYTESYNPLLETSIATYKYVGDEKLIHVPYGFNSTSMLLQWKHEKDAINAVSDHLIGTMVDNKTVLHEYCAECEQISLVPTGEWITKEAKYPMLVSSIFGTFFNWTYSANSDEQMALNRIEPIRTGYLHDLMDHHQEITFDNMAKPFLLFCHYVTHNKFIENDLYRYSLRSMPYYEEPTETILQLSFDINDNSSDENPIAKSDLDLSIILTTRKQHDAHELSHGNLTFKYMSASEANSSDIQPHIHHKYNLELTMDSDTVINPFKICIDRDVKYPSRKTNKFSLDPIDDAKAITTFSLGNVENETQACPTTNHFFITEIYSANENQKAIMEASKEYKNCKEQSKGLKYIPPTDDCFAAHDIISIYGTCDIYGNSIPSDKDISIPVTKHGVHLIRFTQLNDTHVNATIILEDLLERFMNTPYALRKAIDQPDFLPLLTTNPRVIAYDDDELEWGIQNACYITSKRIRTFTGHTIKKYYDKSGDESVAFVECSNATAEGMTIQKYGDKYVGFHGWSYNDTLVVSVPDDGKIKIEFNGEVITKTHKFNSDKYKIYFLDDDVILFSGEFMDIFYTKEYISIQTYSIYNNYICGLCTETQHN